MAKEYIQTGQLSCHDVSGQEISCPGSGQDAAFSTGIPWPSPRFIPDANTVLDRLTGLNWTRDANATDFPMTWQEALEWVRGTVTTLPVTGQKFCYNVEGTIMSCEGTGQDAEFQTGTPWPESRFLIYATSIVDQLTGLRWLRNADLTGGAVSWPDALAAVDALRRDDPEMSWRLPNINELESLIDCASHSPALPLGHAFTHLNEAYWSSTTSLFEPDWAWALYLNKGAIGVGQKSGGHYHVWAVADAVRSNARYRTETNSL
jgi:hypothetical protein